MLARLFEFLFKYRLPLFREGDLAFVAPRPLVVLAIVLALAALPVLVRYRRVGMGTGRVTGLLLLGSRFAILCLVLFCLLQPALVLSTVIPQQSFVGLLMDDSESMQVADADGGSRGETLRQTVGGEGESLLQQLEQRFKIRQFAFDRDTRRIESVQELGFDGSRTALAPALLRAADELSSVPVSGLILLSDGADSAGSGGLSDALLELRSRSMPVYTVGFGSERFDQDIEVARVVAPRSVLQGSSLQVEVTIEQTGYSGSRVALEVIDSGRLLSSQEVRLPTGGEAVTERVVFTASQPGARQFTFRVTTQPGEVVTANNERHVLLEVLDRREKILYFEGEPRFELKFLRRAVADDPNLQVVVLQRTAENKFLRLDIDHPGELEGGFPTTREELFRYRGLILGSVEASFFTYDQMRMIVDFVSQRGGGFLMIGGRQAFSEGGYAGTPIADLLPVVLGPASGGEGEPFFSELDVSLTPLGRTHPALQLADSEEASAERWASLPTVHTLNPLTRLKPGAQSFLVGEGQGIDGRQVVMAHQRFGRGRVLAFSVHDSWLWQMHADIPLEDMTHETFWRQLLRWLVSYVPDSVTVTAEQDRVAPGEAVQIFADVRDAAYLEVNSAQVTARVEGPDEMPVEVPMEWTVEEDGRYRGTFVPPATGLYRISAEAYDGEELLTATQSHFEAAPLAGEFFAAERRTGVLQRIAEETGGRFYDPGALDQLADDLSHSESGGATVLEHRDLWDMPILFLLLVGLMSFEWSLRKLRGLA